MRSQGLTRTDVKSMIRSALAPTDQMARVQMNAFGNSISVQNEPIGNPGNAPSSYIFQAILLTAQLTGSFLVGWTFPWNSDTTNDPTTLAVKGIGWTTANWAPIKATGKIALTGASSILSSNGAATGGAINGGTPPGMYQCTAAGTTITATVTGANSQTTTEASAVYPTLTGLLSAQGMQENSGTAVVTMGASGYAIGSPVLIEFVVSAAHSISMTGSAAFWAYEMPPVFG